MDVLVVVVVIAVVVLFVSAPFRRTSPLGGAGANGAGLGSGANGHASDIAELEAARDAKYREIRDADLDHRTGKLSDADYEALVGTLRAEAIEIMHRLDSINKR
jgi:hypothetical protein